jgi:chondroitin AC lyase
MFSGLNAQSSSDFDELQERLRARYFVPVNPSLIETHRAALNANGSFSNINYSTNRLSNFQEHLDRVAMFIRAYSGGRLSGDPELYDDIVASLNWWLTEDYRDPNWWWTYIGFPSRLIPVTTLIAEHLRDSDPTVYNKLIAYHTRVYNYSQTNPHNGGANMTDMGYRALVGAIMDRNAEQMQRVITNTFKRAIIPMGRSNNWDGWRIDGSMYGHGPQLHNATYGREMALSSTLAISLLRDSYWDMGEDMLNLIEDQLLMGVKRMSYGGWFDWNAAGRAVSRQNGANLANGYTGIVDTMLSLNPRYPERLQVLLDRIRNGPSPLHEVAGTHSFFYSDFLTHLRRNYYTSVRMISNRTNRNEVLNGEGLKHLYFGDGIQFTLVHGDEYASLAPVWNYARLPGLTARQMSNLMPGSAMGQRGSSVFAGSVTDGWTGVAAMRLEHTGMTGWKSWFMLDEGIVAMGSGISVPNQALTEKVLTTLNQTRAEGELRVGRIGEDSVVAGLPFSQTYNDVDWVWHRDVGYIVFGDNDPLTVTAETVQGDWASIGASTGTVSGNVFSLYLDHDVRPIGKSYSYMVLPSVSAEATQRHAEELPIEVLRHDGWVHAVRHRQTGAIYAAFLGEATLEVEEDVSISSNQPVLLQMVPKLGKWNLTVSDPRFTLSSAAIQLEGFEMVSDSGNPQGESSHSITIDFPQGNYLGSRTMQSYSIPNTPPYTLENEVVVDVNWKMAGEFGPFAKYSDAWIYHSSEGWLHLRSDNSEKLYLYHPQTGRWLWSKASLPGWAYDFHDRQWVNLKAR